MNLNNAKFELSAVKPAQYPATSVPEVAFAGRSNVGKSSIINTLLNRKSIARVGAAPGKTREINFYNIDQVLYFVDLPGYGYASVSKEKKSTWGAIIETYLNTRQQLKLIIMMVDIRHKPTEDDKMMYNWIVSNHLQHIVVASKADKISRGQIKARLQEISSTLGIEEGVTIIPFSSEKRTGKEELWNCINNMIV
ncbi:MAG: ribosome biogenesis GTP-binding protein YihA/YsxC [Clostridia bacterium]|nr:ribosome biogenesis GTP-binding protein YihA/YsxC [Clostridia bacterium]